jgi:lipoprotein-anchoring transpeptidase ErfK/SrfK
VRLKDTLARGALGGFVRRALPVLFLVAVAVAVAPAAAKGPSVPKWSAVATLRGKSIAVYERPGAKHPFLRFSNRNSDGAPQTFLVRGELKGWIQIYLPIRPNGSKGWVRARQIRLARDDYYVRIQLRRHRITVWRSGRVIFQQPVGVGRAVLPTPKGLYYIVEVLKQPEPTGPYGPYAFGLSGFSNVLYSFGGGPGQIGLHGTDDPSGLGHDVSHGCLRMRNSGITKLAHLLPLGTPIRITA